MMFMYPTAFDPATMVLAMDAFERAAATSQNWQGASSTQQRFLSRYPRYRKSVQDLSRMWAMVSESIEELNQFLRTHGFPGMFRDIRPGGLGAAAVLDMLVQWAATASITQISTWNYGGLRHWAAFELPVGRHVEVFNWSDRGQLLVKVRTKDGGAFWLTKTTRLMDGPAGQILLSKTRQPVHALDLVSLAEQAMESRTDRTDDNQTSVVIPNVSLDTQVDVDWMRGLVLGHHSIDEVFQLIRLRIDHSGAYIKAASGLASRGGDPQIVFNEPFLGWFTQPESCMPIVPFYSTQRIWVPAT